MEYYFNEDTLEEEEKRKARRRLRRAEVLKQLYSPTKSRPLREVVHVTRKKQIVKHVRLFVYSTNAGCVLRVKFSWKFQTQLAHRIQTPSNWRISIRYKACHQFLL